MTNKQRAETGRKLIGVYQEINGKDDSETTVSDILGDLFHALREERASGEYDDYIIRDMNYVVNRAMHNFEVELEEE